MKNKLKITSLLLALVLAATPLASCADDDRKDDDSDSQASSDTVKDSDTSADTEQEADVASEILYIRRINSTDIEIKFGDNYSGAENPRSSLFRVLDENGERLSLNLDYGYGGAIHFDNMVTLSLAEELPVDDTAPALKLVYEDVEFDVPYDPYYKYEYIADCGVPVRGSGALLLGEETVKRGAEIVDVMLSKSPEIAAQMVAGGAQLVVYGNGETAYHIPETRSSYDATMRYVEGFGGYTSSITESNIWHWRTGNEGPVASYKTAYVNESILVHEFGHGVKIAGIDAMPDGKLATEFQMVYRHAVTAGLWPDTYAISNSDEFFATMTAIWFNVMNESNGDDVWDGTRCPVNTRQELYNYDIDTYRFFAKIYPFTNLDGEWAPVPDTVKVTGLATEEAPDLTGKEVTFAYPASADFNGIDFSLVYKFKYTDADYILDTGASSGSSGNGIGLWWDYSESYPESAGAMTYTFEQVPGSTVEEADGKYTYKVYIKGVRDNYLYINDDCITAEANIGTVPESPTEFTVTVDGTGLATISCEAGNLTVVDDPDNGAGVVFTDGAACTWNIIDASSVVSYVAFVHNGKINDSANGAMASKGDVLTLTAAAELDGKTFVGWRSTKGTIEDASALETTFTMPDCDVVIWADYQ